MFETSLVESSGRLNTTSGRYLWITGTLNAAVVGAMILIPLLYPEALPRTLMTATLMAPAPPASAPPPSALVTRASKPTAPLNAFTAPRSIPSRIDTSHEDPPQAVLGGTLAGMNDAGTNMLGPAGTIGIGSALPIVKVAPPRPAILAHISSGVIAGNRLSGPSPVYPAIARAARISGVVVLHAVISKTGSIVSLSVISGPEMLRASAVSAVQGWKYRPYLLNGEPTDVDTTITVNFTFGA